MLYSTNHQHDSREHMSGIEEILLSYIANKGGPSIDLASGHSPNPDAL